MIRYARRRLGVLSIGNHGDGSTGMERGIRKLCEKFFTSTQGSLGLWQGLYISFRLLDRWPLSPYQCFLT